VKKAIALAAFFLALHVLGVCVFPAHGMAFSYAFCLTGPLIAIICCFRVGRRTKPATAWKWMALCGGLILWEAATAIAAWEDLSNLNTYMVTAMGGFIFFLFGTPLLIAICASPYDKRLPAVVWIDGILAVAVGVLAYAEIFSFLPNSQGAVEQAGTVVDIAHVYDAENLLLAILASVRLLAAENADEEAFYRILCGFLWTYSAVAYFYNNVVVVRWQLQAGTPWDVLLDAPFLVLAALTVHVSGRALAGSIRIPRFAARMIQVGISVSLAIVLLILGVVAFGHSRAVGVVAIVGSLAGYGFRNMLSHAQLLASEDKLHESRKVLQQAALIDPLTGIANRRAFDQKLAREWRRAVRAKKSVAILIIDVDYFKKVNDQLGHQRGDECLVAVARALRRALPRNTDFIARYGGEEFAGILPATDGRGAIKVAEHLRGAVQSLRIEHPGSEHGILTVSIGATACRDMSVTTPEKLIPAADGALYEAKRKGRNRVEFAFPESKAPELRIVS